MRPYGVSDRGELDEAGPVEFRAPNPAQRGAPGVLRRLRRLDLRDLTPETVAKAKHHLSVYEHHDIHLANHELDIVYGWTNQLIEQFNEHCYDGPTATSTSSKGGAPLTTVTARKASCAFFCLSLFFFCHID